MKKDSQYLSFLTTLFILCLATISVHSQNKKLLFDSVAAHKAIEVQLRAYESALKMEIRLHWENYTAMMLNF